MRLDGAFAEKKSLGDLRVRVSPDDQLQHIALAPRDTAHLQLRSEGAQPRRSADRYHRLLGVGLWKGDHQPVARGDHTYGRDDALRTGLTVDHAPGTGYLPAVGGLVQMVHHG